MYCMSRHLVSLALGVTLCATLALGRIERTDVEAIKGDLGCILLGAPPALAQAAIKWTAANDGPAAPRRSVVPEGLGGGISLLEDEEAHAHRRAYKSEKGGAVVAV